MTYRQSSLVGRLCTAFGQQRKLFLLVFLWSCLCLVIFKSTLFSSARNQQQEERAEKLHARSAAPLYLADAPEFAVPDNSNNNALYYSLSSVSSLAAPSSPSAAPAAKRQQQQQPQPPSAEPSHAAAEPQSTSPRSAPPSQAKRQPKPAHTDERVVGSQCHYDYPNLFDLQFNNIHWQKMTTKATTRRANSTTSATFYLYNAYYDDRWRAGLPSVRVLAMIDRVQPPPTNCLLWSSKLRAGATNNKGALAPLVTRASFVYAWYPKWGNYKDGILQPWIVTCPMLRSHLGLVPDSVSLVEVPPERAPPLGFALDEAAELEPQLDEEFFARARMRRDSNAAAAASGSQPASIAMPPSFSSSSPSVQPAVAAPSSGPQQRSGASEPKLEYDCKETLPITNNLPVYNQRPAVKEKFAVCVKGLDFPHEDVSVRLVEWIELLNLLGAGKIFLYNLDVHENISKVLHYYQKRGIVELSPLTLPGAQPNLPEYQHLYLKSKLTAKRQNELIPYNDCLYRNLNSYKYLALLDIDEIIMPLKHHNWYDLMQEVEDLSLAEQNYSRASYNVRNVYFFDDLAGPLGTRSPVSSQSDEQEPASAVDGHQQQVNGASSSSSSSTYDDSLERGIPHYLHMMQHVYRSKNYTKPGQYVKCFHNTERVVSLHNHFPMNCFGQCTTYSVPVNLAHLQHYRKDCVGPLKQSCKNDFRVFTTRDTTIWKYKQQMIKRTTRVLNHLGLLSKRKTREDDES